MDIISLKNYCLDNNKILQRELFFFGSRSCVFSVGAGSAGSVVASRLSEVPCVSVLLLEAGHEPPLLTEVPALGRNFWFTDIDWQYRTAPQKYTGKALINRVSFWNIEIFAFLCI